MLLMRHLFLRRSVRLQPRNVFLAAFQFLTGFFGIFVGLLTIQDEGQARVSVMLWVYGLMMFLMPAYTPYQDVCKHQKGVVHPLVVGRPRNYGNRLHGL